MAKRDMHKHLGIYIVVCTLIISSSFALPAFAQSSFLSGLNIGIDNNSGAQESCKEADSDDSFFGNSGFSGIFGGGSDGGGFFDSSGFTGGSSGGSNTGGFQISSFSGSGSGQTVDVNDEETRNELSNTRQELEETLEEIKAEEIIIREKETCLDALAATTAKEALRGIADTAFGWIRDGFDNDPLFIENYGTYFDLFSEKQFLQYKQILVDSDNPFAGTATGFLSKDYNETSVDRLSFNLDQVNPDWEDFFDGDPDAFDWDTYVASARPENNPIGTLLVAAEGLDTRLQQTEDELKTDLQSTGGFLSERKCVNLDGSDSSLDITDPNCPRVEIVTPGGAVEEKSTFTLQSAERQLEFADEFNEVLDSSYGGLMDSFLSSDSGLKGIIDIGS